MIPMANRKRTHAEATHLCEASEGSIGWFPSSAEFIFSLRSIVCLGLRLVVAFVFLTAAQLCLVMAQEPSRVTIRGKVIDAGTREPIPNVNVLLKGTTWRTSTDDEGVFAIRNIPSGKYTLEFSHVNYNPVTHTKLYSPGPDHVLLVEMHTRPILLDPVEVTDTLQVRFVRGGYVVRREEILEANPQTLGELIQQLVPRAWVREDAGNLHIQLQLRGYARSFGRRDFNPLIIIDGMKIGNSPIGLAQIVSPSEINRLEVFRPPESEILFGVEARYGAIIIETIHATEEPRKASLLTQGIILGGIAALILLVAGIF